MTIDGQNEKWEIRSEQHWMINEIAAENWENGNIGSIGKQKEKENANKERKKGKGKGKVRKKKRRKSGEEKRGEGSGDNPPPS